MARGHWTNDSTQQPGLGRVRARQVLSPPRLEKKPLGSTWEITQDGLHQTFGVNPDPRPGKR
jgi:hypothetical protein